MTAFLTFVLLLAQPVPLDIEQIRADGNLEHRAKTSIEFAMAAERNAEAAYAKGDMSALDASLKSMVAGVETAQQALEATGKSPMRHPGPFKSAELRTQEILIRLGDLGRKMDADERGVLESPKMKVQEIHDAWFDGIMSRKKK